MKIMAGGAHARRPDEPIDTRHAARRRCSPRSSGFSTAHIGTTNPSMTDMDQLNENLRAMSETSSSSDEKILTAHLEQIKPLYCRFCGECDGACRKGLQVADTLRILTYADGYGQFALARERFNELPSHHATVRCRGLRRMHREMPPRSPVSERIARAQELFA